jgi:hypothetical protein
MIAMKKYKLLLLLMMLMHSYVNAQLSEDWKHQNTSFVVIASTPATAQSYVWSEVTNITQGIQVVLSPPKVVTIYAEQGNVAFEFTGQNSDPIDVDIAAIFISLEIKIDAGSFISIYEGEPVLNVVWDGTSTFTGLGNHTMEVKWINEIGEIYTRLYNIVVVPASNKLYKDNFGNTMRVWHGDDPDNEIPLVMSEGYDAYNVTTEQFYRGVADELFNCGIDKGFKIYVLDYKFNSQDMKNNAAVFTSAVKHVSFLNELTDVVACGVSMGGIIARYALALGEHNFFPLPVTHFITIDSPHQGANISDALQDFIKNTVGDPYKNHGLDNDAAKQLLIYNTFNTDGSIHNQFYSDLHALNSDGYPHQTKNVAVSFSTTQSQDVLQNTSEPWVNVTYTGLFGTEIGGIDEDFYMDNEDKLPGSWLPQRTVSNEEAEIYWGCFSMERDHNPTFIPHESSLDITGGISAFPNVVQASATGYHDVVPSDVIAPIINAILRDISYIQNKTITTTKKYNASKTIVAGESIALGEPMGSFIIASTGDVKFIALESFELFPGFVTETGAVFETIYDIAYCDGTQSYQHRTSTPSGNNSFTTDYDKGRVIYQGSKMAEIILDRNNSLLRFSLPESGVNYKVRVYNSFGALLFNELKQDGTTLTTSSLSDGIYIAEIYSPSGQKITTQKLYIAR